MKRFQLEFLIDFEVAVAKWNNRNSQMPEKNSWRFWSALFISRLEGHKDEACDAKSLRAAISFSSHQFAFRLNFTRIRTHYFHWLGPSNPPLEVKGGWKKPLAFVEHLKKPRMTLSINGLSKYDATYHYQAAPKYNKAMPVTPDFPSRPPLRHHVT